MTRTASTHPDPHAPRDRLHLRRAGAEVRRRRLRRDRLRPRASTTSAGCWWSPTPASPPPATRSGSPTRWRSSGSRPGSSTGPTSSPPTTACARRSSSPARPVPGTPSSRSAAARRSTPPRRSTCSPRNPGELMDYVNVPGRQGAAPVNALAPAGRRADHDGHRQREHHDLRARRAVAEGEDRDQPPAAAAHAGRGRPAAHADPAGRGHRGLRGWTSSATRWRAGPRGPSTPTSASSPSSGCPTAGPTRSRTCGRRSRCRCSRRPSAARCATATTRTPAAHGARRHLRRDGLRQRRRAHPARQRLPDRGPGQGLPPRRLPRGRADGAARHGGVADRARGVPVHLRRRARAAPPRRGAARPVAGPRPATRATCCRRCSPR